MKKFFLYTWMGIVTAFSGIIIIADRLIMSFLVHRDMPGWHEINEFDHEKENLSKRLAIYGLIAIFVSSYWWVGFIISLF